MSEHAGIEIVTFPVVYDDAGQGMRAVVSKLTEGQYQCARYWTDRRHDSEPAKTTRHATLKAADDQARFFVGYLLHDSQIFKEQ